jgi:hypothetical protein
MATEMDDVVDVDSVGDDGGQERVVHHLPHHRDGHRPDPVDLTGLPGVGVPADERVVVGQNDGTGLGRLAPALGPGFVEDPTPVRLEGRHDAGQRMGRARWMAAW